jgi:hypothetical protein
MAIVCDTFTDRAYPNRYGMAESVALPPLDVIEIVPDGGGAVTVTLADWPWTSVPPAELRW